MAKTPVARPASSGDASRGQLAPAMSSDLTWKTMGSTGLRQWSGWVREEFLPQLVGRQGARVYREMADNSPTVGAILFAIQQTMRQASWRVTAPDDTPEAQHVADFVESCMHDMSDTWSDFTAESLTMLPYGYAPHEVVYKRRMGRHPKGKDARGKPLPASRFNDGMVGLKAMPLRGQDTILKWFFDDDGTITGLTQQPYSSPIVDIPIEKLLLFRPKAHKNNPEGYSILRTAYRPWFFLKRLEEQEAIYLERMSGIPEYRVPINLLNQARDGLPNAVAALNEYKKIVTNARMDEQMGIITPSDVFANGDGTLSSLPQYEFRYVIPQGARTSTSFDPSIERYKLDILTSTLTDFLTLGHSARGTQSLADTKVDLFFGATEGWMQSNADVLNERLIPRLGELNGFDEDLLPKIEPDMPERTDLDVLSNFVLRLSQAGARLFPDDETENYLRDVAGLPELTDDQLAEMTSNPAPDPTGEELQKHVAGMLARRLTHKGYLPVKSGKAKRKRR